MSEEQLGNFSIPPLSPAGPNVRVFGIGGAGGRLAAQWAQLGRAGVSFYALNSDLQALRQIAGQNGIATVQLGVGSLRGLGAGGDPEMGRQAAEEQAAQLKSLCQGAQLVIILAGLGGGNAGAAPVLARMARAEGALTLGVVTLPFSCEGRRRNRQAMLGLRQLRAEADAVLCLPNERLLAMSPQGAPLLEILTRSNEFVAASLDSLARILLEPGLVNLDFAALRAVVSGRNAEGAIGTVEIGGEDRGLAAWEQLQKHILLDEGRVFADADAALVCFVGGPDMTMAEIEQVMQPLTKAAKNAHILMGATVDEKWRGRLQVTVVVSQFAESNVENSQAVERPGEPAPNVTGAPNEIPLERGRFVAPAIDAGSERSHETLQRQRKRGRRGHDENQPMLPLEMVPRGRFEKSERTVRDGEDLDVPTYIRQGIKLN